MNGNRHDSQEFNEQYLNLGEENSTHSAVSIEQLQQLVQLLDNSDVSEIELKRASEGTRLVLRKAKMFTNIDTQSQQIMVAQGSTPVSGGTPTPATTTTTHKVVASLVGIFHRWAKPKGGTLVAVGDNVKAGQLVGMIESLNVMNEVETSNPGRVVEILVEEGQAVEYGQPLMIIDSAEGA